MKCLIIYSSKHHLNTKKVAERLAAELGAELVPIAAAANITDISGYDLLGFGSGVYFGQPDRKLLEIIRSLPEARGKKAFYFFTSGTDSPLLNRFKPIMSKTLTDKGFNIVGGFSSPGWDTYGALKLIGGVNKKHPNDIDLNRAAEFAAKLKK